MQKSIQQIILKKFSENSEISQFQNVYKTEREMKGWQILKSIYKIYFISRRRYYEKLL